MTKKIRIFDLAKVLCFSNQNGHRKVLFMFDIFRLKPFFPASLGECLPMLSKLRFFTQSGRHLPKTHAIRSFFEFYLESGLHVL